MNISRMPLNVPEKRTQSQLALIWMESLFAGVTVSASTVRLVTHTLIAFDYSPHCGYGTTHLSSIYQIIKIKV
jgi:hypothetical protein